MIITQAIVDEVLSSGCYICSYWRYKLPGMVGVDIGDLKASAISEMLQWAAKYGQIKIAMELLATGKIKIWSINEALWWAAGRGCPEIVQLLLDTGMVSSRALGDALCRAADQGIAEIVNILNTYKERQR
jgi:hypothetical protein